MTHTYLYLGRVVPVREYVEQRRVRYEVKPYACAHDIAMIAQSVLSPSAQCGDIHVLLYCIYGIEGLNPYYHEYQYLGPFATCASSEFSIFLCKTPTCNWILVHVM